MKIQNFEYNLKYLNFPIIANVGIFSHKKFFTSIFSGFVFNQIRDYDIKLYYINRENITENYSYSWNLAVDFILGSTFSKSIGNKYRLNLSPFVKYKLKPHHDNRQISYKSLPDNKLQLGVRMGIEYLFKTREVE